MKDILNCIAIDDESSALDVLSEFCSKIRVINLIGKFSNPSDAIQILNNNQVDLIFLNIKMSQISGPSFLKSLLNPPMVIFTSSHKEDAFESYECDAVDFLVRPIHYERFLKAVNKAIQNSRLKREAGNQNEEITRALRRFLMVKVEYSTIRVDLNDILYIEGLKDYVKIITEGKPVLTKTTMKNIMEKLPPDSFFRVHKSYIVAMDKIDMIENSRIVISNQRIPIGESFRSAFIKIINNNLI